MSEIKNIGDAARSKVPLSRRLSYWDNQFVLFGYNVVVTSALVGGIIGLSFPPRLALIIIFFAMLSNCIVATLIGGIAARTGYSSALIYRFSFGKIGTLWPNLVMAFTGITWFSVIVNLTRDASIEILGLQTNSLTIFFITILIGIIFAYPAYRSIKLIARICNIVVPILILMIIYVITKSIQDAGGLAAILSINTTPKLPLLLGFSIAAGGWLQGATVSADFSRFFRNAKESTYGSICSFGIILGLQYIGGAFGAAITGEYNIFFILRQLGGGNWLPFIAVFLATWSTNQAIMYGCSLQVAAPPLPMYKDQETTRKLVVIALWIISMIICFLGVEKVFNMWLVYLASIVGPIATIVILDYWAFPKRQILYEDGSNPDMIANPIALISWIIGFLVGHFSAKYSILTPVLNSMVITGVCYYFLMKKKLAISSSAEK